MTIFITFNYVGYGVFCVAAFDKGSFLLEYPGPLIDILTAEKREEMYRRDGAGCFLYYFNDGRQKRW